MILFDVWIPEGPAPLHDPPCAVTLEQRTGESYGKCTPGVPRVDGVWVEGLFQGGKVDTGRGGPPGVVQGNPLGDGLCVLYDECPDSGLVVLLLNMIEVPLTPV